MKKNDLFLIGALAVGGYALYRGGTGFLDGIKKTLDDAVKQTESVFPQLPQIPTIVSPEPNTPQVAPPGFISVPYPTWIPSNPFPYNVVGGLPAPVVAGTSDRGFTTYPGTVAPNVPGGYSTSPAYIAAASVNRTSSQAAVQPTPNFSSILGANQYVAAPHVPASASQSAAQAPSISGTGKSVVLSGTATQTTYVSGGTILHFSGLNAQGNRVYR